jgi:tight adherence protein B
MSVLVALLVGSAVLSIERAFRHSRRHRILARFELQTGRSRPRLPSPSSTLVVGVLTIVCAAAGFAVAGVPGCVLGIVAVVIFVLARRRRLRTIATRAHGEQLADAVRSMAAGLRAGLSVAQAIEHAAAEVQGPLARELGEIVRAHGLGVPLEDALDGWARAGSTDEVRLVVGALELHRRSGGDLPGVLDQVGATLRERRESADEVRALTAQARMSGAILGLLPIGFFAFLWVTSRSEVQAALGTPAGLAAVTAGVTLEALAFVWIRHLLAVR